MNDTPGPDDVGSVGEEAAKLFGALSGVSGAVLSVTQSRLPTGPMIILSMTAIVIVSLAFAPAHRRRGPSATPEKRHLYSR